MLPKTHFLFGIFFSLMFFPVFKWNALIIPLATVLIDIDHYFVYVILKKDLNLLRAYSFFRKVFSKKSLSVRKNYELAVYLVGKLYIFHTLEFLALLFLLGLYSRIILLVFIGFLLHLLLDLIGEYGCEYKRTASIIYFLMKKTD